MVKYRIKLSPNMAKQVEGVDKTFDTSEQAYNHAVQKYGSGSHDSKHGWSVEEVKGKGWNEAADGSGKAPRHKAVARAGKLKNTLREPMEKKKSKRESLLDKWTAHLNSLDRNHKGFEMFDYNSGTDSVESLEKILTGGREALDEKIDELRDYNESAEYEMFRSTLTGFLKDEKLGESTIEDDDAFRQEFEGHVNWNVEKLFDFNVLLIEKKKYDGFDYEASNVATAEEAEFKKKALKYISQKQLDTILANSYGGVGYFGIITNGQDIIKAIRDNEKTDNASEVIVGIHDWLNGAGYFERGHATPNYVVNLEGATLDTGEYGVGGVFGTSEWSW